MQRWFSTLCGAALFFSLVECEVYFEENFGDDAWKDGWIYSEHPGVDFGKFLWSSGIFFNDQLLDKGIQTSEDARFYAISSRVKTPFSNKEKPLVVQFSVKHEQNIDCGGGYLKLFDCSVNPSDLHGESPYQIMFGPDICGPSTKKVHVIFNYKNKNYQIKKDIRCKDDVFTHFYTLIIMPDNTYKVLIDNENVESGALEDDWDFLPQKKIKDPNAKKPQDWDDKPTIPDPNDKKPEDWDKPEHIPDPDAIKPEDWDDEMDGEWERPMVDNPDYKGDWQPKEQENPNYKGEWEHPLINNPKYISDENLYVRNEICLIGLDLWQVKSGTIFDNFLLTDDLEYASKLAGTVGKIQSGERKMKDAEDNKGPDISDDEKVASGNEKRDVEDNLESDIDFSDEHDEL